MIIPINIIFLIESSQEIQFLSENQQRLIKTQVFPEDKVTIELDNHIILISYLKTISLIRILIISIKLN
jgi:hypothetical protein